MNKKISKLSVAELTKNEISALENTDKISKLEKERSKDKKIIAEYKEREKATARALVLYERKIKFLKSVMIDDIVSLSKSVDTIKNEYAELLNIILVKEVKEQLSEFSTNFTLIADKLYDICNKIEMNSSITKEDRAFILNNKVEETKPTDSASRFDRLKQEFNQKIGSSVSRRPGRPKKQDQSIIADIGLRKKVEKQVQEKSETMDKLNELFYVAPSEKATTKSNIPQTSDSIFDFNEALNPDISLKDIMADILAEPEKNEEKNENDRVMQEVKKAQRQSKIELLESGYLRTPTIAKPEKPEQKTIDSTNKKATFEKRFLSIQNITKQ